MRGSLGRKFQQNDGRESCVIVFFSFKFSLLFAYRPIRCDVKQSGEENTAPAMLYDAYLC